MRVHFLGAVSFGAPLPPADLMRSAARHLGGAGFGPVLPLDAPDCRIVYRTRGRPGETALLGAASGREGRLLVAASGRIDRASDPDAAPDKTGAPCPSAVGAVLAAFDRWETEAADRLRGDFAFAAWDRAKRRLTLARDTFGAVPLFHHRGDGFVVFGTAPLAMLALDLMPRDLDAVGLGQYLACAMTDHEATVYRAIRRVPRAAQIHHGPDGARTEIYWRPNRDRVLRLGSDAAYVEAAREVLDDVLRGHLANAAPLGVMLSGGFDSGALAATLARLAPHRAIHGFTTVPDVAEAGREWQHVQRLGARYPNLRLRAVAAKPVTPIGDFWRDVFAATGLPVASLGLAARRVALAQAAVDDGVGVLLRGDGGNQTLTAKGSAAVAFLSGDGWGSVWRNARRGARFLGRPMFGTTARELSRALLPSRLRAALRRLRGRTPPLLTPLSFLRAEHGAASGLLSGWEKAPLNPVKRDLVPLQDLVPLMLAELQPPWADAYTLLFDHMGLEETPAPFRDRRMVDFTLSLPENQFLRDGEPRFLARRALADRLPAETLAEPGYFPPFPDAAPWSESWREAAVARLGEQSPMGASDAVIDLARLRDTLAAAPLDAQPEWADDLGVSVLYVSTALHVNEFIRWTERANR